MSALLVVLVLLTRPVELPASQPLPPWPAWACETGGTFAVRDWTRGVMVTVEIPTVCQFNPEAWRYVR